MFTILLSTIIQIVHIMLTVMQFMMFGRAIMSWFAQDDENKIARFLFVVTEPVVAPVRAFISKIEYFNRFPVDISFIVTILMLMIVRMILPHPSFILR